MQIGNSAPGAVRFGDLRIDLGPVEEIVEAHAGARHDDAAAERAAEALRHADEIALVVRDGERRGVPGVLAGGGLHPLLGRAGDRFAVAHTRAQTLDMLVAEQARQFLRRRIVVVDAHARREADRAVDEVEVVGAVAVEPREIEAFEDAQREQELEAFAGRRRRRAPHGRDTVTAIGSFQRGATASRSAIVM